tara:strand:- start:227 stop:670 length:444 start_codon:yes stop_codon:yes gene_type:complete
MSNYEDFFSLDDYVNITFGVLKKKNNSGGFYFETSLYDDFSKADYESEGFLKLSTRWRYLDWDSKKDILNRSKVFDPVKSELSYDPITYRDNLVKKCLLEWNFNNADEDYVKVDSERIDGLPPDVVDKLLLFYERAIESEEDCLGKA